MSGNENPPCYHCFLSPSHFNTDIFQSSHFDEELLPLGEEYDKHLTNFFEEKIELNDSWNSDTNVEITNPSFKNIKRFQSFSHLDEEDEYLVNFSKENLNRRYKMEQESSFLNEFLKKELPGDLNNSDTQENTKNEQIKN